MVAAKGARIVGAFTAESAETAEKVGEGEDSKLKNWLTAVSLGSAEGVKRSSGGL